jgi:pyruvate/2-oxoacid:ferredoxin oxidoreductase beta subunit
MNHTPPFVSLKEYVKLQGRFKQLGDDDVAEMEKRVRADWQRLARRAETA